MLDDLNKFQWTLNNTTLDVEFLKKEVGQRFPFYDMKSSINTVAFFCRIDEETLEEKFDSLRKSLKEKGYIPMLRFEKGEHVIYVIQKTKKKERPIWINLILLIATVITTTLAGSLQWVGIYNAEFGSIFSPDFLANGFLYFSMPLLAILGIHEMGHYYASRRHNVAASLPFFIPLPPPFILGTLGAFISTREPIPNRKALLDIGVAGPICGFLVAIPVSIIGFYFMQQNPIYLSPDAQTFTLEFPLLLQWLSTLIPTPSDIVIHPTAFAGWVGLFITALNLLPIGQLDGGHVIRALFKDKSKYIVWLTIILLLLWGLYVSITTDYIGWLIFLMFIMLLIGTQHPAPLNEISSLDSRRKIVGVLALIIFILCLAPIPMSV